MVLRQVKPLPEIPSSVCRHKFWTLSLIQVPANAPGKAAQGKPSPRSKLPTGENQQAPQPQGLSLSQPRRYGHQGSQPAEERHLSPCYSVFQIKTNSSTKQQKQFIYFKGRQIFHLLVHSIYAPTNRGLSKTQVQP